MMKQPLVNPIPQPSIKRRFKFNYRLGLLTLLFIFFGVTQIIAQSFTDNFESETTGATTFSEGGASFSTNGSIDIGFFMNAGFAGMAGPPANDSRFLEAFDATGNVGEIMITTPSRVFQLEMIAVWLSTIPTGDQAQAGSITFTGTPAAGGATIPVTFNTNPATTNTWEVIDFAGTALTGVNLSKVAVTLGTGIQYMALDNFKFTHLDASVVSLTIDDVSIAEGNSGTTDFVFTVTRSDNSSTFMVTAASADETASSGTDYTLAATNLNFTTGGPLTQTVIVPVSGDFDPELDETFFVNLTNATNGVEIIDAQGIGTILDDDLNCETFEDEPEDATTFTQNGISFSTNDQLAIGFFAPGGAGSGQSDFYLESNIDNDPHSGSVGQIQLATPNKVFQMLTVDLWLSTDGDPDTPEDASVDFIGTLASGGTVTATLTTTGSSGGWVEGLSFAGTPLNGALLTALEVVLPAEVHYIAIDNFKFATFDMGGILVSIDDVCLNEGNSGNTNFTFTVSRSDVTTAFDVTVQSADGSAIAGADYTAFGPTVLNFAANGPATQTVNVQVTGDIMSETPETFFMNLSNITNEAIISNGQGAGIIKDDDTICETFEDEATAGLTVFSEPGVAFSTTGTLVTAFFAPGGGGGAGSDYYLESPGFMNSGSVGSINVTTPNTALNLLRLDLWLSNDTDPDTQEPGMVQLVATLADGTTLMTDLTTTGSQWNENILLSAFTGSDVVAIEVILLGTSNNIAIDNICFEVIDLMPTICPTVEAVSASETAVCVNAPFNLIATGLADMDMLTNMEQDFGVAFVAFPTPPADPYTGGTSLDTVPFGSLTGGNTTAALIGASLAASGSYEIYAILSPAPTDATCRPAAMTTITINVPPTPTMMIPAGEDEYCMDNTTVLISLAGSPSGGIFSGSGVNNIGDGINFTFNPAMAGAGTHIITYTFTDLATGCTNTATDNIIVNPLPTVTFTAPMDLCLNAGIQNNLGGGIPTGGTIFDYTAAGDQGVYSGPGVTDDGNGMTYSFDPAIAGAGVHDIVYTYCGEPDRTERFSDTDFNDGAGCCCNSDTTQFEVFALPTPTFTAPPLELCIQDTVETGLGGGTPTGSGGIYSGLGVTDDGNGMTYSFDPTASAPAGGNISVTYTFTDANGCSDNATDDIVVNPICCELDVTCPTGPVALQSMQDLPSIATSTDVLSEFTSRGGVVIEFCDPVVITASDADNGAAGCMGAPRTITRTFTVMDPVTGAFENCPVDYVITDTTPPVVICAEFSMTFTGCPDPIFSNTPSGDWFPVPAGGAFPTAVGGSFITTIDLNGCVTDNYSNFGDMEWELVSSYEENRVPGCSVDLINEIGIRDACGNVAPTTFLVRNTIQFDGPAPVITCPAILWVKCGDPTDPAATGMATATSDCGTPAITFSDVSVPSCGLTEVITRTWTATDGCGTTTTCDQIIIINDTTPPTITCAPQTTPVEYPGVPVWVSPTVTDVCGATPVITFADIITPACGNTSSVTRTWTATDACGNAATCSATIEVEDTTPPMIICPTDPTIECELNPNAMFYDIITFPFIDGAANVNIPAGATVTNLTIPFAYDGSATNLFGLSVTISSPNGSTQLWNGLSGCGGTLDFIADDAGAVGLGCVNFQDGAHVNVLESYASIGFPIAGVPIADLGTDNGIWTIDIVDSYNDPLTSFLGGGIMVEYMFNGSLTEVATAMDNCDPDPAISFTDLSTQGATGCSQYEYIITRTWTATDVCGNASTCEQIITVGDSTPPMITCPADLTIECDEDTAPANTGMATGTDNCSTDAEVLITFNDLSTQTSTGCGQYRYMITRTWTATDACGNNTTCVQVITVEDSTDPIITCPADQTLVCNTDPIPTASNITDFIAIGGTAADNCSATSELTVAFLDSPPNQSMLNFCSTDPTDRTLTRTYTVTDACGNSSSCAQNFVYNQSILDPVITAVPADQTADCAVNAFPQVHLFNVDTDCGLGQTVTVSEAMTNGTPGCPGSTIQFTYTATDVCGRSVSHTQTYTLTSEGPEFICPADICVIECPADTDMIQAQFDSYAELATVITSCSETSISIGNNFNSNGFINQNCMNPTVDVPGAVAYQIVAFTATDACGRNATCTALVVITDGDGPVMTGNVSFGLADCNDTDLQQGYTNWATSQMNSLSATDECSNGTVNFSYTPLTPNVDCSSGLATTEVSFMATDACGNATIRNAFYRIIDNGTEPTTAIVSGSLFTEDDEMIALANVETEGFSNQQMMTNDDGYYHFDLAMAQNYTIAPSRNDDPLNGVTTFDLILMGQHLLEINTLDSPYKMIAADVNESGHISSLDMIELRRLILHIDDEFSAQKSWTFVDAGYVFPEPTNPFATTFPTAYNINNLTSNEIANFIGVKLGDLNATANVSLLQAGDTRSFDGSLNVKLEDQQLKAGQAYELAFKASDFKDVAGFQFTLNFASDYLQLMDYQGSELTNMSANNFGFTKAKEGKITVSWNENTLVNLTDDATIFKMQFVALKEVRLSESLSINSSLTPNEAYQADLRKDVKLVFEQPNLDFDRFILFQNQPNPFMQETVIGFQLSEASDATLTVFDVAGRVVWTQTKAYETGIHQVMLTKDQLESSGVYYYQLSTGKRTATKKMIVLE